MFTLKLLLEVLVGHSGHSRCCPTNSMKNVIYRSRLSGAGKYKLVTFAHRELNLHKVFWEVQSRGGYQAVCATKQWKVTTASRLRPRCCHRLLCCPLSIHEHETGMPHGLRQGRCSE